MAATADEEIFLYMSNKELEKQNKRETWKNLRAHKFKTVIETYL